MAEKLIEIEPENYYHVYNHAIGKEKFFLNISDGYFFLIKVKKYLEPFYEIIAYNLMINHFHLILRAKNRISIEQTLEEYDKDPTGLYKTRQFKAHPYEYVLSKSLSNLFNSYTKHYNTNNNRKGSLFRRAFRRKHIIDENYLRDAIIYVHQNPVAAGICAKPEQWELSSYKVITEMKSERINWKYVIELFDDLYNFVACNCKENVLHDVS
jgi:putative transposase